MVLPKSTRASNRPDGVCESAGLLRTAEKAEDSREGEAASLYRRRLISEGGCRGEGCGTCAAMRVMKHVCEHEAENSGNN